MDDTITRIKEKFNSIKPKNYWGDDFDVRYFLISKINKVRDSVIMDIGGGIGIINSESHSSNKKFNLDLSINDLKLCNNAFGNSIENACAEMKFLPIKDNSVDLVICAHLFEVAKYLDIKNNNHSCNNEYPTLESLLKEIKRILKKNGTGMFTTPNNQFYKSTKLEYNELKKSLDRNFKDYNLFFYNVFPNNKKHRKFSIANIMPKLLSKIKDREKLLTSFLKEDEGGKHDSISFFVEVKKK